jgi:hypothetical protein
VAHFVSNWSRSVEELKRGCNALLPPDITLRKLEPAPEDFHARHSAHSKTYVYKILNLPLRSPLNRLYSWHVQRELDLQSMSRAAEFLLGTHDFAAFGAPTEGTPSTVRRGWRQHGTEMNLRLIVLHHSRDRVSSVHGPINCGHARAGRQWKGQCVRIRSHSEVLRPLPLGSCSSSPRLIPAIGEL